MRRTTPASRRRARRKLALEDVEPGTPHGGAPNRSRAVAEAGTPPASRAAERPGAAFSPGGRPRARPSGRQAPSPLDRHRPGQAPRRPGALARAGEDPRGLGLAAGAALLNPPADRPGPGRGAGEGAAHGGHRRADQPEAAGRRAQLARPQGARRAERGLGLPAPALPRGAERGRRAGGLRRAQPLRPARHRGQRQRQDHHHRQAGGPAPRGRPERRCWRPATPSGRRPPSSSRSGAAGSASRWSGARRRRTPRR